MLICCVVEATVILLFYRMKKKELKFYESRGTLEKQYSKVNLVEL